MSKFLHDLFYKIKCHFRPYNVIKIKTLPKTWSDESDLLVHGMFEVLRFHLEENSRVLSISHPREKQIYRSFMKLHVWFKKWQTRQEPIDRIPDHIFENYGMKFGPSTDGGATVPWLGFPSKFNRYFDRCFKEEKEEYEEETRMLFRLIKLRKHLWS